MTNSFIAATVEEARVREAVRSLLDALLGGWSQDPNFAETPGRVARMFLRETCRGLTEPPPAAAGFPVPAPTDEMIMVGPCAVRSLCPHHLLPIIGEAWVGVIPSKTLLGLSKYSRIVEWCAARPIMQETLTQFIADHLAQSLPDARGIGVVIKASHLCMQWRGVRDTHALTTTSAMRGLLLDKPAARAEFLSLIKGGA